MQSKGWEMWNRVDSVKHCTPGSKTVLRGRALVCSDYVLIAVCHVKYNLE